MKEKYYTPDISEFHIGFEYEFKPRIRNGIIAFIENRHEYSSNYKKDVFCSQKTIEEILSLTYDSPTDLDDIGQYIKDGAVRVKYLNQEDIESLGFDLDSTVKQESFYIKGNIMNDNEYQLIYRDKEGTTEIYSTNNNNNPNSFYGIIKNKSELKKILKQIGL